jgi:CubicO group peptidase (beta-lactamase class C family)
MKRIAGKPVVERCLIGFLLVGVLLGTSAMAQHRADLPQVKPEAVGFSSERLRSLDMLMRRLVDEKEYAGIVTMAARHGKVFQSQAYGLRDMAGRAQMRQDSIFRIYSMTKPVTGVAMMMLYEEGKWSPGDPLSKYIPEFAGLKVLKGYDAQGKMLLEDPVHPPTMRELMTHTAGFGFGFGQSAENKLYQDEHGGNVVMGAPSFEEMIHRLAKLPLLYQPGTRWVYGVSMDIQGYLVEKMSGRPFPQFLKERIFDPLGMSDTGFYVPEEKKGRLTSLYQRTGNGELVSIPDIPTFQFDREPALPSGGGGLVSTAGDYLKFAQMLLNGGELAGVRLLGPKTVDLMRENHLPEPLTMTETLGESATGMRWAYDIAVITDPGLLGIPCGKDTFWWGGAAGTWFWVDPANDLVFVGMVQRLGQRPDELALSQATLYQALIDPRK